MKVELLYFEESHNWKKIANGITAVPQEIYGPANVERIKVAS